MKKFVFVTACITTALLSAAASAEVVFIHGATCFPSPDSGPVAYGQFGVHASTSQDGLVRCPIILRNWLNSDGNSATLTMNAYDRSAGSVSCSFIQTANSGHLLPSGHIQTLSTNVNQVSLTTVTDTIGPFVSTRGIPFLECIVPGVSPNGASHLVTFSVTYTPGP